MTYEQDCSGASSVSVSALSFIYLIIFNDFSRLGKHLKIPGFLGHLGTDSFLRVFIDLIALAARTTKNI